MLGGVGRAQSPSDTVPQILDTWYHHYLGRNVDQGGLDFWGPRLVSQNPQRVLAGILASDEYWNRTGANPAGLVLGLYRDVLGRDAAQLRPRDVWYWINKMNQYGSRQAMIREFIRDANTDIFNPPAIPMRPPLVQMPPSAWGPQLPPSAWGPQPVQPFPVPAPGSPPYRFFPYPR
jgi:hypothetical protein